MNLMICMGGEAEQLPFLPEIAELGAGIELGSYGLTGIRSMQDWEMRFALHKAVRAQFPGPIAIHGPFLGMQYTHIDHLIRNAVKRRMDMTFDVAAQLKANRVVLHSSYTPEIDLFQLQDTWLEGSVEFWRQEILRWEDEGIGIVLENDTEPSPDWIIRLVKDVDNPYLGLCLDIGHLHVFSRLDGPEWVRRMGSQLRHIHLHDNDGSGDRHWPLGRGTIDFHPFFAAITQRVPDATLALEVEAEMEVKMDNLHKLEARFGSQNHYPKTE